MGRFENGMFRAVRLWLVGRFVMGCLVMGRFESGTFRDGTSCVCSDFEEEFIGFVRCTLESQCFLV
jgi:hypothetical protein